MSKNISTILAVLEGGVGKGGGEAMEVKQSLLFIFPSLLNEHILAGQPTSILWARKSFPRKYVISFHSFSRELQFRDFGIP